MRILLTGATGFLGKNVLKLLLESERVDEILVLSRGPRTHPDPRVMVIQGDLALAQGWRGLIHNDIDHVVHLAGLYNFEAKLSANYKSNVIATLNLIDFCRSMTKVPLIHFASTYAVGFGLKNELLEEPLTELPDPAQAYAYTKAVAEKAITDSNVPYRVFRLGVLVGDQHEGTIEKIDGPYYVYDLAYRWGRNRWLSHLPTLPLPFDANGILPVVPVDAAATVMAKSVLASSDFSINAIFNVLEPSSALLKDLSVDCFSRFLPRTKVLLNPALADHAYPQIQTFLTGIPSAALGFASRPIPMSNTKFIAAFGDIIPPYSQYKDAIFSGFIKYVEGLK